MIEQEMDDLALLWTEEAAPQGEEALAQELARGIGWRRRLMRYADLGGAVAVAAGLAMLALMSGAASTAVSGLIIVLALGWLTWKRQAYWELERSLEGANREELLANAAGLTRARLKRTNLSLIAMAPTFLLGLYFGYGLADPEVDTLAELVAIAEYRGVQTVVLLAILVAMIGYLLQVRASLRRELRNIEQLGAAYGEEAVRESRAELPR